MYIFWNYQLMSNFIENSCYCFQKAFFEFCFPEFDLHSWPDQLNRIQFWIICWKNMIVNSNLLEGFDNNVKSPSTYMIILVITDNIISSHQSWSNIQNYELAEIGIITWIRSYVVNEWNLTIQNCKPSDCVGLNYFWLFEGLYNVKRSLYWPKLKHFLIKIC